MRYSAAITYSAASLGATASRQAAPHDSFVLTIGSYSFDRACSFSGDSAAIFTGAPISGVPNSSYRSIELGPALYIDDIFVIRSGGRDLMYVTNGAAGNAAAGYPLKAGSNVYAGTLPAGTLLDGYAINQADGSSGCGAHLSFSGTVILTFKYR